MGAAMMGPIYSLRENGAQHGGHGLRLRVSTLQGSKPNMVDRDKPTPSPPLRGGEVQDSVFRAMFRQVIFREK